MGLAALTVAAALVFWVFDALPFQDLPAHAGLIALRHRLPHSPFEQRFFVLAPSLGPYSLFRFLGDALVQPLGPVGAIRAIATLPVVATPLVVLWARRTLHGDRSTAGGYFAIALGFGFMTVLGFASYLLGIAALLAVLTLWLKLLVAADRGAADAWRWETAIALAAPALFLVHGDAFVVFLGLTAASASSTGQRAARWMRLRALAPAVTLAAWVAWRERASALPVGSAPVPHAGFVAHFQGPFDKLTLIITPTLITRTGLDAIVAVFLWGVLGGAAVATARSLGRPRPVPLGATEDDGAIHARALLVSAVAAFVAFLVLPHSIGWFGFVDGRLVPVVLFLMLLAVRRETLGGGLLGAAFDRGSVAAATVMVAIAFAASWSFQGEAVGWREVLHDVPTGARLLNLPIEPNSRWFTGHPFVHYDKLALAERPLLVSDVWFHQGTGLYPTADNPSLRLPDGYSESDLRSLDWASYRLSDWDYALVRTGVAAVQPAVPARLTLATHRGGWWLFRIEAE